MRTNYNQFLAVVYGDIFDWPLTKSETRIWEIQNVGRTTQNKKWKIGGKGGYYFLPGREKLAEQRVAKEKISYKKRVLAETVTRLFSKIPTIAAIFLTGSVALGAARNDGDVDLMIITAPNTLWTTRVIVVALLKAFGTYGNSPDRICPNIFLDTNHLEIKEKNLYTAHEILQAECLFDGGQIEKKWLRQNSWTGKYLPNAYSSRMENCKIGNPLKISNWKLKILGLLELPTFVSQYLYQLPKQTSEKLGWGFALFHPNSLAGKVEDKFRQRLVKYS